jgi:hypothetical protein
MAEELYSSGFLSNEDLAWDGVTGCWVSLGELLAHHPRPNQGTQHYQSPPAEPPTRRPVPEIGCSEKAAVPSDSASRSEGGVGATAKQRRQSMGCILTLFIVVTIVFLPLNSLWNLFKFVSLDPLPSGSRTALDALKMITSLQVLLMSGWSLMTGVGLWQRSAGSIGRALFFVKICFLSELVLLLPNLFLMSSALGVTVSDLLAIPDLWIAYGRPCGFFVIWYLLLRQVLKKGGDF